MSPDRAEKTFLWTPSVWTQSLDVLNSAKLLVKQSNKG